MMLCDYADHVKIIFGSNVHNGRLRERVEKASNSDEYDIDC